MVMVAKIIAVNKSKSVLATYWEFEFCLHDHDACIMEGTLSVDEAIGLANRPDTGAIFQMCRTIKATPSVEFSWLVGRIFNDDC